MIALLSRLVVLILIFVFVFVFVIQAQSKKYERNTAGQLATQSWSRLATTISGEELPALDQSIVNFFLQNQFLRVHIGPVTLAYDALQDQPYISVPKTSEFDRDSEIVIRSVYCKLVI